MAGSLRFVNLGTPFFGIGDAYADTLKIVVYTALQEGCMAKKMVKAVLDAGRTLDTSTSAVVEGRIEHGGAVLHLPRVDRER